MRSATATSLSSTVNQTVRRAPEPAQRFTFGDREEQLLNLNLSDLAIPDVNDLHVDGFKRSWLARLFGGH